MPNLRIFHKKTALIAICLLMLAAGVFAIASTFDFINYDDPDYILENQYVKEGLTLNSLRWAFTTDFHQHWHPLTWISHMLDVQWFGLDAGRHHAVNILLHALNTLFLFLALFKMTKVAWKSALVAALFAVHPVHVEPVAWVTGRKDLLSAFFMMLTLWAYACYVEKQRIGTYLLALALFGMGLLSKSMLVTLPVVLILLDYWPLGRFSSDHLSGERRDSVKFLLRSKALLEKIPFFLFSIIDSIVLLEIHSNPLRRKMIVGRSLGERLLDAANGYAHYVEKLFWPQALSAAYQQNVPTASWVTISSIVLLLCISFITLMYRKRRPYLIVGWLWFLGMLLPVIGLLRSGPHVLADRYSYVTYIGLFMMISWAIGEWSQKGVRARQMAISGSVIGIVLLSFSALIQLRYWQNSVTLFSRAVAVNPKNITGHLNLGLALHKRGDDKEAKLHLEKAVELGPEKAIVRYGLGSFFSDLGKSEEAMPHLLEAVRLQPGYHKAHVQLGINLARAGKFSEAYKHFEKAIELDSHARKAHYNYGVALGMQNRYKSAIVEMKKALEIDPDYVMARNKLNEYESRLLMDKAKKLYENQKIEDAAELLEEVVRLFPNASSQAYFYLGLIASGKGELDAAGSHLGEAIKANPQYAEAYVNLGIILNKKKAYEKAEEAFTKAIEIGPGLVKAHYNYAVFLYLQHRNAEAVDQLAKCLKLDPNDKKARDTLGFIKQSVGKKEP